MKLNTFTGLEKMLFGCPGQVDSPMNQAHNYSHYYRKLFIHASLMGKGSQTSSITASYLMLWKHWRYRCWCTGLNRDMAFTGLKKA